MRLTNKLDLTLTLSNERIEISKTYPVNIEDPDVLRDILIISADVIAQLRYVDEGRNAVEDYRAELLNKYFNK